MGALPACAAASCPAGAWCSMQAAFGTAAARWDLLLATSWGLVYAMLQVGGALGLSSSGGSRAACRGVQRENHGCGFSSWRKVNAISINMVQMHQKNAKKGRKLCRLAFWKGSGCLQSGCYFARLQWPWRGHTGVGGRGTFPIPLLG